MHPNKSVSPPLRHARSIWKINGKAHVTNPNWGIWPTRRLFGWVEFGQYNLSHRCSSSLLDQTLPLIYSSWTTRGHQTNVEFKPTTSSVHYAHGTFQYQLRLLLATDVWFQLITVACFPVPWESFWTSSTFKNCISAWRAACGDMKLGDIQSSTPHREPSSGSGLRPALSSMLHK